MHRLARYKFSDGLGHPLENCIEWKNVVAENARLRAALKFYADEDARDVELGVLGHVNDRPATKALGRK